MHGRTMETAITMMIIHSRTSMRWSAWVVVWKAFLPLIPWDSALRPRYREGDGAYVSRTLWGGHTLFPSLYYLLLHHARGVLRPGALKPTRHPRRDLLFPSQPKPLPRRGERRASDAGAPTRPARATAPRTSQNPGSPAPAGAGDCGRGRECPLVTARRVSCSRSTPGCAPVLRPESAA